MKAGEYGWIQEHMEGIYLNPTRVKILSTDCPGIHNIKVATESGRILYCTKTQIKSRPRKAMKIEPAIPEEVKAKAEHIAEKKIQEFKENQEKGMEIITEKEAAERKERKKKAGFDEVRRCFRSLVEAEVVAAEHPGLKEVIDLAAEQIRTKYAGGWEV